MLADLPFRTLADLGRQWRAGETTSLAIVEACLANIAAQDARLHAFVELWGEDALRLARAADLEREAGFVRGPLHGLPIAVKDLFDVAGRRTTAGSTSRPDHVASATATSLRRLLAAGMIPLGKTHLVEFAYGTWGTNAAMGAPWNPWDPDVHRVAGGSSSGSAVAVASGMAPAALGTDTGGSVRIPAALCGLVGLKPTYGRIPLDGVVPLATALDSVGPLTRTVEDAVLLVDAMADAPFAAGAGVLPIDAMRVTALAHEQFPAFIEADVVAAYERTLALLRERGARVALEPIPFDFAELGTRNGRLIGIEGYAAHRAIVDDERTGMDPGVRQRMLLGRTASAAQYFDALAHRRSVSAEFARWMMGRDVLATPMLPITARRLDEVDETTYPLAAWSRAVNYVGACAISIPAGVAANGLPVGVQLVAAAGDERRLCALAAAASLPPLRPPSTRASGAPNA